MSGLDVFGSGPGVEPFEEPKNDGERFHVRNFVGETLLLKVYGPKNVTGPYGDSTVIVADVVVLGEEPQEFPQAWLGSAAIVNQLLPKAGASGLVATVGTYKNKRGQTGYRLEAPDAKAVAAATAFQQANESAPF